MFPDFFVVVFKFGCSKRCCSEHLYVSLNTGAFLFYGPGDELAGLKIYVYF